MSRMHLAGKPLLIILGPTAVGKTGLAIEAAKQIGGEIISADSRQIYRKMDIGTAKPTPAQQAMVPHHLIDVVEPNENLSLADYQKLARSAIDEVHSKGFVPMLVGGTGQYITALVEGWSIPQVPPNDVLRSELEAFAQQEGAAALHLRLETLDPTAAANIDYRNVRRVVRALEVCIVTGEPISELQRKQAPDYDMKHIGLTMERETLYEQADRRVDLMMQEGFLNEVEGLLAAGYSRKLPSMSGLGYAELTAHVLDNLTLEEAIIRTKHSTHDFIRRQYTWFRGHDPGILWHNITNNNVEIIFDIVVDWLKEFN
ncbi:MAG: tRNA (adenosine(37)-N6)-dimethylallyltransferase MiaA [Anaerolineaceae bacterium]|nr:tRNA (adenosine(37)-N6)-dimethylallyltransferase MiaA [Anaerolineaceae bacterium]